MDSVYKLTYFPIRGRAENARLMFAYKGVKYEDIRITQKDWPQFKSKTPVGQMPILEVDGEMMWQSKAIDFYLADVFKLSGNSAKEKYLIQRLVFDLEDISIKWPKFEKDEKVKAEKIKGLIEEDFTKLFQRTEEDLCKRNCGQFYLKEISLADFNIHQMYTFLVTLKPDIFDKTPKLKNIIENVEKIPNVKKWLDERPKTDY